MQLWRPIATVIIKYIFNTFYMNLRCERKEYITYYFNTNATRLHRKPHVYIPCLSSSMQIMAFVLMVWKWGTAWLAMMRNNMQMSCMSKSDLINKFMQIIYYANQHMSLVTHTPWCSLLATNVFVVEIQRRFAFLLIFKRIKHNTTKYFENFKWS